MAFKYSVLQALIDYLSSVLSLYRIFLLCKEKFQCHLYLTKNLDNSLLRCADWSPRYADVGSRGISSREAAFGHRQSLATHTRSFGDFAVGRSELLIYETLKLCFKPFPKNPPSFPNNLSSTQGLYYPHCFGPTGIRH